MANRNAQQRLQDAIDALPREVLPQRDLWPGIAHALIQPEPAGSAWLRQMALAASVVLVLGMSVWFGVRQPPQPLQNSAMEAFVSTLRSEHERNKELLLASFEDQEPVVYPDWEQTLIQLEQAEAVIFEELRDDPENLELIEILRGIQDRQLDLIDKVFDAGAGTI